MFGVSIIIKNNEMPILQLKDVENIFMVFQRKNNNATNKTAD